MATRGIQPQNDGEGSIGIPDCKWGQGCFNEVILPEGNVLDLINQTNVIEDGSITGSKIADGSITLDKLAPDVITTKNELQFCRHRSIVKKTSTVELKWREPDNPAVWKETIIVKKQGSYPETPYPETPTDGIVVTINTKINKYAKTAFVDTQENNEDWYYRAFPVSNNDAVSYHELNKFGFWLYGCYIDETDAVESTCVHYLPYTDSHDYAPIKMMFTSSTGKNYLDWGDWEDAPFMPKPCMLKSNGEVYYYLNPNDLTKKADGTASDVANTNYSYDGNAMMEWSPVFMKVEHKHNRIYLYFSSHKIDDDYECYSAKKADGTYGEHFYLPIFEGSIINNKLRSIATNAKPTDKRYAHTYLEYATNNGDGWTLTTWADENLIQCLGILVMKRLNCEEAIGHSCGSYSSGLTNNVGDGMKKGMFFGNYTTSAYGTKFFGMENWWGHRWRLCVGIMMKDYKILVKMTRSEIDGSGTDEYNLTGEGYISTDIVAPPSSGFITDVAGSKYGVCIPTATKRNVNGTSVGGSSTTYFCDYYQGSDKPVFLYLGGSVADGDSNTNGLFRFCMEYSDNHDNNTVYIFGFGASISYRNF